GKANGCGCSVRPPDDALAGATGTTRDNESTVCVRPELRVQAENSHQAGLHPAGCCFEKIYLGLRRHGVEQLHHSGSCFGVRLLPGGDGVGFVSGLLEEFAERCLVERLARYRCKRLPVGSECTRSTFCKLVSAGIN